MQTIQKVLRLSFGRIASRINSVAAAGVIMIFSIAATTARAQCTYSLAATSTSLNNLSGSGSVTVLTSMPSCPWSATTTSVWISITTGTLRTGSGIFGFSVEENIGAARDGVILVASQVFAIHQDSNPDFDRVRDYILGSGALLTDELVQADANFDGAIDVADLVTIINQRGAPPGAVRWINPNSGDWNVGANWSTGKVPGPNDAVVIDTPTSGVTVTVSNAVSCAEVRAPGRFRFGALDNLNIDAGGSLSCSGAVAVDGLLTVQNGGRVSVTGAAAGLRARGTTIVNGTLSLARGAQGYLPGLTSLVWNTNANPVLLDVEGGALLDLPNLASITFLSGSSIAHTATLNAGGGGAINAGGSIRMPALTTLQTDSRDHVNFQVANSGTIDLSALTTSTNLGLTAQTSGTLTAPAISGDLTSSTINIAAGGTVSIPQVDTMQWCTITDAGMLSMPGMLAIYDTQATFDQSSRASLPSLIFVARQFGSSPLSLWTFEDSTSITLGNLQTIIDLNMTIAGSATISAPALTGYASSDGLSLVQIQGAGVHVSFPVLANVTNQRFQLRSGTNVTLPQVAAYYCGANPNPIAFDVAGGSVFSLPSLASISFSNGAAAPHICTLLSGSAAFPGGQINMPALTNVQTDTSGQVSFNTSTGGVFDIHALTATSNLGFVVASNTSITAPALAGTLANSNILVFTSGTLTLGAATGLDTVTVKDDGALLIPNLATVSNSSMIFEGTAHVNFPLLTLINRTTAPATPTLTIQADAAVTLDSLTTIGGLIIVMLDRASLSMAALTSYTSSDGLCRVEINNTSNTLSAPVLASISNVRLLVRGGATLSLPSLTAFHWTAIPAPTIFDVSPAGSRLDLHNLTLLEFNTGDMPRAEVFGATSGGYIDLSSVGTFTLGANNTLTVSSNGGSSLIDLGSFTPPEGSVTLSAINGGSIHIHP